LLKSTNGIKDDSFMRINNQIRLGLLAGFVFALVSCTGFGRVRAQSAQQLHFPYQAFVLHDEATVHSGPGNVHYATERLRQGAVVEVYREDPGGWCAIRPVDGSFSLVPEATLEIVGEGVGRVLENGTQAWVGTKLGPVDKPLWQVKLQKSELVEVLGQVSWPNPEGHSTIWYQISPPAGEFRWVRISDIQLPAEVAQLSSVWPEKSQTATPSNPSQTVRSFNEIIPVSPALDPNTIPNEKYALKNGTPNYVQQATLQTEQSDVPPKFSNNSVNVNRGWRQASRPIGSIAGDESFNRGFGAGTASDGSLSNGTTESFLDRSAGGEQSSFAVSNSNEIIRVASVDPLASDLAKNLDAARIQGGSTDGAVSQISNQLNGQYPRTVPRNLSDLESQLTREMIKEDPSDWSLEDLEIAANGIYRTSQNPTERSMAERYLAKVANCKAIRAGFRGNAVADSGTFTRQLTHPIGTGVNADVELGTTYDAHGWLTELVRDGGNSRTEYALQDASGKITHHIAPAPGMNLRRYLKSHVGVIGQRGYHSQLKLDHVLAHRIVKLEKPKSTFRK
jgi:hypothetical protein